MSPALQLFNHPQFMAEPPFWMVKRIVAICNEVAKHCPRQHPQTIPFENILEKRLECLTEAAFMRNKANDNFIVNTFLDAEIENELELLGLSKQEVSAQHMDENDPPNYSNNVDDEEQSSR